MIKVEIASNVNGVVEYRIEEFETNMGMESFIANLEEHEWLTDEW